MNPAQLLEVFFVSILVAYLLTPFVKQIAVKTGYLDHPKDHKVHGRPTPLLGGLSIFVAIVVSILTKSQLTEYLYVKPVLAGASILFAVGLIDDRMGMMPSFKILGQFFAAMVVIKSGLRVGFIDNYYLSTIVTYIWIIGITNSFNLMDNMNGLSAGVAAISALFFGVISFINGQPMISALSLAVAGGTIGFLRYNFPKAQLFMGDAGSLVLGYILSTIALMASWKSYILTTSLAIPVLILGYPIFDTMLVTAVRMLEKRSVFQGGKDHSSHRLALLGLKRYKTVLLIYAICVSLGMVALAVTRAHWMIGIVLIAAASIAMLTLGIRLGLVNTSRFGYKKD